MPQEGTGVIQMQHQITIGEEILSAHEAELLDSLLEKSRGDFEFQGKKIAFITGSSGSQILSKADYFKNYVNPSIASGQYLNVFMIELNEAEKRASGGYDALVLSWVKVLSNRQKRKVIEQLAKTQ
jgi:hypothetical protein